MMTNSINNTVVCGNCLAVLDCVDDNVIDLTFTSPPYYNAREYTQYSSYDEYLSFMASLFDKLHRVTREGRYMVINTSPVITPRAKRSTASIRHPIPFDLHAQVKDKWTFIEDIVWVKPEPSVPNRTAGFNKTRRPLSYKPNSVTEYLLIYRKRTDKLIDWNIAQYDSATVKESLVEGNYERTNVWQIPPARSKDHPAVMPRSLAQKIIAYYSYVGDLVLDPFAGSGIIGEVANELRRHYFLIELNEDYVNNINRRLNKA